MVGKLSRDKGKRGEREFAALCRDHGYDARRGVQYNGLDGEDVIGLPGVHIEVKRTEALRIYEAIEQAARDAKAGQISIVAHRRNNADWLIVTRAEDWFPLYREWESGRGHMDEEPEIDRKNPRVEVEITNSGGRNTECE